MKYGIRKPSLKKSLSARTTGRAKRAVKKAINPLYGKKGIGWISDPKKAAYNKVYRKTTVSAKDSPGCLLTIVFYPIYLVVMLIWTFCKGIFGALLGASSHSDNTSTISSLSAKSHEISSPTASQTTDVDLSFVQDRYTSQARKIGDCIRSYCYTRVPICDVERAKLIRLVQDKSYVVTPAIMPDKRIALLYDGDVVAYLSQHVTMCLDWLVRGDPVRCEVTGFKPGKEHVVLAFYRNEEALLQEHQHIIVKLTTCTAEAKQESISICTPGDKLSCAEEDSQDGKVAVLDCSSDPIGRLPKKYADIFVRDGIAGIFFDHAERNDNYKLVPFVRIYLN